MPLTWDGLEPAFECGATVYVATGDRNGAVAKRTVRTIECVISGDKIVWSGMYRVYNPRAIHQDWVFHTSVFATPEEAERAAAWVPVSATEEQWAAAIGDRDDDSHIDSELGTCCAEISNIRDILIDVRANGGLMSVTRDELREMLFNHTEIDLWRKRKNLWAILEQMGTARERTTEVRE